MKILDVIDHETGGKVAISMGYVGLAATNTSTNNMLLFMRGPDDGQLRVRLEEDSGMALADLRERLRKVLPEKIVPWLQTMLQEVGLPPELAAQRARKFHVGFEPGDIVSEVMSLGSPTPIEVVVAGPDRDEVRGHADKILAQMQKIPTLRDVQFYQQLDYPAVHVDIDRQRAGLSGVTIKDVTDSLLVGTSSSRYIAKNYWRDPSSGVDYQVQVQVPAARMDRPEEIGIMPLQKAGAGNNLLVRDVATVQSGAAPGQVDRTSMQRYLSVIANVEGEDLGRVARRIQQAVADAGAPPHGVRVILRGQVKPMEEMFQTLAVGLILSVVVILVMLTGYFQSLRMGLISIGAVPGVICGVVLILLLTGTTLNIESFMGSIMCIGVSVANSVMLTTFMSDYWRSGMSPRAAAVKGAKDRLRPVLMTAIAMVLGTVPMAVALEKGSEMTAPLGRAVIGGLVVSTFATLLIVPAMFTWIMQRAEECTPRSTPTIRTAPFRSRGPGPGRADRPARPGRGPSRNLIMIPPPSQQGP